jgi:hypothetical protein
MPAVPSGYTSGGHMNKPTCFDRVKIGFAMGFTVGMVMGVVFGGFAGLRYFIIESFFLKKKNYFFWIF